MFFNKKVPDKKDLLKELDVLGYSARVKKMAILGRDNNGSKQYSSLLSSLLEDGSYEAHLALVGALVTKNTDIILSALKHCMASVRKKAAVLLAKVVSDDDIVNEIEKMSQDCRRCLMRKITSINRQPLAERLIPLVYSKWGAHEAAILLPACSKETVKKYLPDIGYVISNWHMLTYRNLDVVLDYFKTSLENASLRQKTYIWWQFSTAIHIMCALKAEFILDCAMNYGPKDIIHPLIKKNMGVLVRRCPDAVFNLLVRSESRIELLSSGIPEPLLYNIKCLSKDQWIRLGKIFAEKPLHVAMLLHYIAPSNREDVFEAVYEKETRKEMVFPELLLYELPHKLRDSEAVRMLSLRQISENRAKTYMITLCRDIDNSREILQTAARSSNADERAQSLAWLIRSTALSRHGVNETLTFLCRIKNEQDPVRSAVFSELSKCNASIYTDDNIKELTLLVDSVVEARDTSYSTRYAVQKFAFAIMIHNASNPRGELFKFSLTITKKLAKQTGQLVFPSLERNIPRGLEKNIFDEIYPLVVDANRRENYSMVIALAGALGKRGYYIKEFQSLLKEVIVAKPDNVAIQAVRHWLAPKKTRDERVKELLGLDKSFILIREVFLHLHMRRQEWLDPFISGEAIRGKFLTGNTIYVVPADNGFRRWLPRQQNSYASLLERILNDSKRSQWERTKAIKTMARMPDVSPTKVIGLINNNEVAIIEAALYSLSLMEEPEKSIPILLENIEGDRARVAMYAIPRCARLVKPDLLVSALRELLGRDNLKITVRKEAIRLVGAYKSSDSILLLMSELKKTNQHKDVLIAVGHAARQLLDNEDAWCVLNELVSSSQIDIVRSLLYQQPDQLPADYRSRYLQLIIRVANHNEADVRKEAFSYMKQWINENEELVATAVAKAIVDLECCSVWNTAMDTLIEACSDGKVNDIVINIFKDLVSCDTIEGYNATVQRDLPRRQRLMKFVSKLTSMPSSTRLNLLPLYKSIIECLSADKTLKHVVIKVHGASIDWNDLNGSIAAINSIVDCINDYPNYNNIAYNEVLQNLKDNKGNWEAETLLKIVDIILKEGCYKAQFISLALLEAAGSSLFWRQDCADRLKLYRNHKDVGICTHALDIWTAIE